MHIESYWLYPIGWVLAGLGAAMAIYGLFSSGAPQYSETLNLGLLNDKTNLTIAGGFSFTAGLFLLAIESFARRVVRALFITRRGAS